jgi:hypothetical protein
MKKLLFYALPIFIFTVACTKNQTALSPAELLSGSYIAKTYNDGFSVTNYPINGKLLTMQIEVVSDDTVHLHLNSTNNGFYSIGDTVINKNFLITKTTCSSCEQTVIYKILLGNQTVPEPGSLENTIWFDKSLNAYYTFVPPGYAKGEVQTVMAKSK